MDKIIVKGYATHFDSKNLQDTTIELSPREFLEQISHKQIGELLKMINLPQPQQEESGELKADEVTLAFFRKYLEMPNGILEDLCREIIRLKEKPQQEFCKCSIPTCQILGKDYDPNFCFHCWKPIHSEPKKEIEELDREPALSDFISIDTRMKNEFLIIKDKLNELIRHLNRKD